MTKDDLIKTLNGLSWDQGDAGDVFADIDCSRTKILNLRKAVEENFDVLLRLEAGGRAGIYRISFDEGDVPTLEESGFEMPKHPSQGRSYSFDARLSFAH